mmetsp:Transcript_31275/g.67220  ORF Transcript_31275/g.67220 Transcript_31275/m.67220 type:complete len:288 (-) Transcript_31275:1116-1979(-)
MLSPWWSPLHTPRQLGLIWAMASAHSQSNASPRETSGAGSGEGKGGSSRARDSPSGRRGEQGVDRPPRAGLRRRGVAGAGAALVAVGRSVALAGGAVVGHEVGERVEGDIGRDVDEVGDARGVDARVVLDLLRPARVLVPRLEEPAPLRVEGVVVGRHGTVDFRGELHLLRVESTELRFERGGGGGGTLLLQPQLGHHLRRVLRLDLGPRRTRLVDSLLELLGLRGASHLLLELGHDEQRAPAERALRAQDVRVHVVAHVEQVGACAQLEERVQVVPVAALEDAPDL